MFAKFNFLIAQGVFRFERHQDHTQAVPPNQDTNSKRKREGDVSDEGELYQYGTRSRSPTPEAFYFGSVSQPSAEYQSWNYRWRGEETGGRGSTILTLQESGQIGTKVVMIL